MLEEWFGTAVRGPRLTPELDPEHGPPVPTERTSRRKWRRSRRRKGAGGTEATRLTKAAGLWTAGRRMSVPGKPHVSRGSLLCRGTCQLVFRKPGQWLDQLDVHSELQSRVVVTKKVAAFLQGPLRKALGISLEVLSTDGADPVSVDRA